MKYIEVFFIQKNDYIYSVMASRRKVWIANDNVREFTKLLNFLSKKIFRNQQFSLYLIGTAQRKIEYFLNQKLDRMIRENKASLFIKGQNQNLLSSHCLLASESNVDRIVGEVFGDLLENPIIDMYADKIYRIAGITLREELLSHPTKSIAEAKTNIFDRLKSLVFQELSVVENIARSKIDYKKYEELANA